MCKLLVLFFVMFFHQKGTSFGKKFRHDYLYFNWTDFDDIVGSSGKILHDLYEISRWEYENQTRDENFTSPARDCSLNDPRSIQPITDDRKSVILNACFPNESRKAASVSSEGSSRFQTYSGFFLGDDTDESTYSRHHFWLFMTDSNLTQDPLIIYLHASPHTSLLAHFFSPNNSTLEGLKYNFLFIEYKTHFGFNSGHQSDEKDQPKPFDRAIAMLHMIDDFFIIFPEFKKIDVYIAGNYEAGKIAEMLLFTWSFDIRRKESLKGAIITHGALDTNLMINFGPIWSQTGAIDIFTAQYLDSHETLGLAVEKSGDDHQLEYFVSNFLQNKVPEIKYATEQEKWISETIENTMFKLFDDNEFKLKHNIGDRNYIRKISLFGIGTVQEYVANFERVLKKYKVLYCNGQLDNIYTYGMTTEYLKRMRWPFNDRWYHAPRQLWYEDGHLVGYWKNCSNLHQVLIRNTGYSLDLTRPKVYLRMIDLFVQHQNSSQNC